MLAALYHPPGGIIRHDAVVWGYARGADRAGVELHPFTEVTGIDVADGAVTGVRTTRGDIRTGAVLNATAGFCSTVAKMVGLTLPVTTHPLQAFVTEPLNAFLDKVVVSSNLHVYVSQTDRGECVIGSEIDPYTSVQPPLDAAVPRGHGPSRAGAVSVPKHVRVLRQWAGICDMTPDYSPIMGEVPGIRGFYLDVGWGTYGFKAGPVSGRRMAELIATRRTPDLIKPFSITRFVRGTTRRGEGGGGRLALAPGGRRAPSQCSPPWTPRAGEARVPERAD